MLCWRLWGKDEGSDEIGGVESDASVDFDIDAEAKELYARFVGDGGRFSGVNTPAEGLWKFRFDDGMRSGQPNRYLMLTLAGDNIGKNYVRWCVCEW